MGFVFQHEREEEGFCETMRNGVVVEFGCGEKFCLFLGVVGTEDLEISLNFLAGSFGLSISLRVIGSGEADIIVE